MVYMLNKLGSNCEQCMKLIRIVVLEAIIWNRRMVVRHIRSEENVLSDSPSHLDMGRFWRNAPSYMNKTGDEVTNLPICPVDQFWEKEDNYLPSTFL